MSAGGYPPDSGAADPSVMAFDELVIAWKLHVQRLQQEQNKNLADPGDIWGIHDYIAALYIRDRVAARSVRPRSAAQEEERSLLESADEDFHAFTEPDDEGLLTRLRPVKHDDSAWWWERIPKKGPARQELLRFLEGLKNEHS